MQCEQEARRLVSCCLQLPARWSTDLDVHTCAALATAEWPCHPVDRKGSQLHADTAAPCSLVPARNSNSTASRRGCLRLHLHSTALQRCCTAAHPQRIPNNCCMHCGLHACDCIGHSHCVSSQVARPMELTNPPPTSQLYSTELLNSTCHCTTHTTWHCQVHSWLHSFSRQHHTIL
jgi:hypothetical protein